MQGHSGCPFSRVSPRRAFVGPAFGPPGAAPGRSSSVHRPLPLCGRRPPPWPTRRSHAGSAPRRWRRTRPWPRRIGHPCPGRRRWRWHRRTGRGPGPASSRTSRRTGPAARGRWCRRRPNLPVPQLADVEVAGRSRPPLAPGPNRGRCRSRSASAAGPPPPAGPGWRKRESPRYGLGHRRSASLIWRTKGSSFVAALEERNPAPGAHAANTDDFAGEVAEPVLLEQVLAVARQGRPVWQRSRLRGRPVSSVGSPPTRLVDADHERWVAHEAELPLDLGR